MSKQLLCINEAVVTPEQHCSPCYDCPWSKNSLPGWLGGLTALQWLKAVVGEDRIYCHTKLPWQCAGAAIFRSNIAKRPRDRGLLILPKDILRVFSGWKEFRQHHERK